MKKLPRDHYVNENLIKVLKKHLDGSPVLSPPLRSALLKELAKWPDELPFVNQHTTRPDKGRPKSSKLVHFFAVGQFRLAAAEYLRSLEAESERGTFDANVLSTIEWAKKKFPDVTISRAELIKEYSRLKNGEYPVKPMELHECDNDELSEQYEQKIDNMLIKSESDEDRAFRKQQTRRMMAKARATSEAGCLANIIASQIHATYSGPSKSTSDYQQQDREIYEEFAHALLSHLARLLLTGS